MQLPPHAPTPCTRHRSYAAAVDSALQLLRERGLLRSVDGSLVAVLGGAPTDATLAAGSADGGAAEGPAGPADAGDGQSTSGEQAGRYVMLQRSGGGANLYAATDTAAAWWRAAAGFDEALYVVDGRQGQHFQEVFALARDAG